MLQLQKGGFELRFHSEEKYSALRTLFTWFLSADLRRTCSRSRKRQRVSVQAYFVFIDPIFPFRSRDHCSGYSTSMAERSASGHLQTFIRYTRKHPCINHSIRKPQACRHQSEHSTLMVLPFTLLNATQTVCHDFPPT